MLKNIKETAAWERGKGEFSVIEFPAIIVSTETFVHLQKDAGKNAGERWVGRFSRAWIGKIQY